MDGNTNLAISKICNYIEWIVYAMLHVYATKDEECVDFKWTLHYLLLIIKRLDFWKGCVFL